MTITTKQRELLEIISSYISRHGFSPTLYELRDALQLASPAGVQARLAALKEQGLVQSTFYKSRTIRLTAAGQEALK